VVAAAASPGGASITIEVASGIGRPQYQLSAPWILVTRHTFSLSMAIKNVSDTAKWVAEYRAMETDRPDAIFRDPYARRLAGPEGAEIVASLPRGKATAWPMIA